MSVLERLLFRNDLIFLPSYEKDNIVSEHSDRNSRFYFDPKVLSKISRLDLRVTQIIDGFLTGMHKSTFFGQSVEFVQHREYVPGDDIRRLDWKTWSKTDRFYIKQFEEETDLSVLILLDTSESMQYKGTRACLRKFDYAVTIAACLGYLTIHQHDNVGLISFDDSVNNIFPPRNSQYHLNLIFNSVNLLTPKKKSDILPVLRKASEIFSKRGLIIILSDFFVDREALFRGLDLLIYRKHDVILLQILDPDEIDFPFVGMTRFLGMESMPQVYCDPRAIRDAYIKIINEFRTELRHGCIKREIDFISSQTSDYLDTLLTQILSRRMSIKQSKISE